MYWVTSFARPVVEKLGLPMILRSFFQSVKQGKRFCLLMVVLLNLPIASVYLPTAIAQEKLQDFDYWASLCSSLVKSRKYKEAVEACNQAITLNTNEPIAWLERGDAMAGQGMYIEAVVSYDRFIKLKPDNSGGLAKRCGALMELERYEDAIASCELALRLDQNWADASPAMVWYIQGALLKRAGKMAEALESLGLAIRSNPNYSLALTERCDIFVALDRSADAIQDCDRAIKVNANWGRSTPAIAWKTKGKVQNQLKRFDEALFSYDKAVAIEPTNAQAWAEQGMILWRLGRYAEALASQEWSLKAKEKYSLALANSCAALNQLRQYKEALVACNAALQEGDQQWDYLGPAWAWDQRANALNGLGKYEEALASANRAISLQPSQASFWGNRAATLWALGRFDLALSSTNQAIALNQNSSSAWFNHGRILTSLGRSEEALKAYDKAIEGDANIGSQIFLADIWTNKSALLWRLNRFQESLMASQQALGINPKSDTAWFNRGLAMMSLGRNAEAATAYGRAIAIDVKNADYWTGRGLALLALNSNADALVSFEQALKLNPSQMQATTNKAIAIERLKPKPVKP
jgi:tetratricopeptide (TPR) repeat protein